MLRVVWFLAALSLTVAPTVASAQILVPKITFKIAPKLIVAVPGIQVVHDHDHEIFFVHGYYWYLVGGHWYHSVSYKTKWIVVDVKKVPPGLIKLKPGKYKRFRGNSGKVKVKGGPPPWAGGHKGKSHGKSRGRGKRK